MGGIYRHNVVAIMKIINKVHAIKNLIINKYRNIPIGMDKETIIKKDKYSWVHA